MTLYIILGGIALLFMLGRKKAVAAAGQDLATAEGDVQGEPEDIATMNHLQYPVGNNEDFQSAEDQDQKEAATRLTAPLCQIGFEEKAESYWNTATKVFTQPEQKASSGAAAGVGAKIESSTYHSASSSEPAAEKDLEFSTFEDSPYPTPEYKP